jgi:hypothetical protein
VFNLPCALKKTELPEIERHGRGAASEQRLQAWHANFFHGPEVTSQDLILPLVPAAFGAQERTPVQG